MLSQSVSQSVSRAVGQAMDSVLPVVLFTVPIQQFDLKELLQLRISSKEFAPHANDLINHISQKYQEWHDGQSSGKELAETGGNERAPCQCAKCNAKNTIKFNPFKQEYRCPTCYGELVTLTKARKEYKLTDDDLDILDYITRYIKVYRKYITLFWHQDIIALALLKHKQTSVPALTAFLTAPKPNKAKEKRIAQLETALNDYADIRGELSALDCAEAFIANGMHGIKRIQKMFAAYLPIRQQYVALQLPAYQPISQYIVMSGDRDIGTIMKQMDTDALAYAEQQKQAQISNKLRQERTDRLVDALKSKGLSLRSDSTVCTAYINGSEEKTLDEVVATMSRMNFFHTHTRYPQYIRDALRDAYEEAKIDIRDTYGYIEDPLEYEDLLRDAVDHVEISEMCQKRALAEFKKQRKDWLAVIPRDAFENF